MTSHRLIEALEQERARIARELHDDIGQRVALLTIELELQQNSPNLPAEVRSRIGELRKQSFEIATDIQSLSHTIALVKTGISGPSGGHAIILQRVRRATESGG